MAGEPASMNLEYVAAVEEWLVPSRGRNEKGDQSILEFEGHVLREKVDGAVDGVL